MAFDQNSVPKDLRPLNVARSTAEEPRISVPTTANQGVFTNVNQESSSPAFYPVPDARFVGLGYGNAVPANARGSFVPVLTPVGNTGVNQVVGYGYNPNLGNMVVANAVDQASSEMGAGFVYAHNLGNRISGIPGGDQLTSNNELPLGYGLNPNSGSKVSGSAVDHASDEGGDDSLAGKKVKFLCSFGGKIFPRPSDGILRYVGGQTRIVSVRRDVNFNELVQKMTDTYGQPVVIKYQLPDEDLDALVSVSCPDDLDNMMEEYDKLVERSTDGSAKLRVFLFSTSELDTSGVVQFGDLHDSGQRYVEAVNGVTEVGGCGGIVRKESIASQTSTQNSDFSGSEAFDGLFPGQGDTNCPPSTSNLSPTGISGTSHEISSKMVCVDPNPAIYADASAFPLGTPVMKPSPLTLSSQPEVESESAVPLTIAQQQMGVDLHQRGGDIPPSGPYMQAYMDPRQEVINHADYLHPSSQMGFPSQLLGHAAPVFNQQQSASGFTSHQFIPAMHMSMAPSSSHVGIRPTMVQPLMQPQQTRLEQYPDASTFGTGVVQLPVDQSYKVYPSQVPSAVVGGAYVWPPITPTEHLVISDGAVPHQHIIIPQKFPKLDDCHMCQKSLPHAHSDPLAQDQRDSASSVSDSNSVYHSLHLEDVMRTLPVNRVMVTGAMGEGVAKQGTGPQTRVFNHNDHQIGVVQSEVGFTQNVEAQRENERIHQKTEHSDNPRVPVTHAVMGLAGDAQPAYGVFMGAVSQSSQEDAVHQQSLSPQYQVNREALLNKQVNSGVPHVGLIHVKSSERLVHEHPKENSGKLPAVFSKDSTVNPCTSSEHRRPTDGMMEALQICPSEFNVKIEQNKLPVDNFRKEDVRDGRPLHLGGRGVPLDNAFSQPSMVLDTNQMKTTAVPPSSHSEVSYMNNPQLLESYEVAQPPIYQQSNIGIQHLDSGEARYGSPALSAAEPAHLTDRFPPAADWKDEISLLQPKIVLSDAEAVPANVDSSLLSPSLRAGDAEDSSNSLFSNQDPWNFRQDSHFPPPRPNKLITKNEGFLPKDPFNDNRLGNIEESITEVQLENAIYQPLSDANKDFHSEHTSSKKGSAEELVKQELQAVAEGVAASVFQSATHSNPDLSAQAIDESGYGSNQEREVQDSDVERQHTGKLEGFKNKVPEKVNVGFPVSGGIGRLQIIKNSDLEELRELGSGTFGTVYHGKWRGTDVAIKRINDRCFAGKPSEQERMIDDFWNEAIKLADLHHPNVVAFYGVVLDGPGGSVATVTEYMVNGSLRNALQKNERNLDKRKRLLIAMDVAFGMEYLHGKNIVHFDLKSDNLLVNLRDPHRPICKVSEWAWSYFQYLSSDHNCVWKVGDLGLSKVKCQTLISGGVRGTLPWMAPELLNGGSSLVSEKVDVFSFGIVLWELLTGDEPYADLHYGAIIGGIVSNTLRPPVPESCDPEWRSLMERCWSSESSERPSFTEIANELRSMAAKIPPKGQNPPQQHSQPHVHK